MRNVCIVATLCIHLCAAAGPSSVEEGIFKRLSRAEITDLVICGVSANIHSRGPVTERMLQQMCDNGQAGYELHLRRTSLLTVERELAETFGSVREVEPSFSECRAIVRIRLGSDEKLQLFVMADGQMRLGEAIGVPANPRWFSQLLKTFAEKAMNRPGILGGPIS